MKNNIIYNEDCLITLDKLDRQSVDIVLTSPPYNMTKRKGMMFIKIGKQKKNI